MNVGSRIKISMYLRSLAIQGSWNYRTLIGGGFAFALLPVLRAIYAGRPDGLAAAIERHRQLFNSHPYLVGVALGAVTRLEAEGVEPATIERFKSAVRGSLGGLGDGLIWVGWRPLWAMIALLLLSLGAEWWLATLVFLGGYNLGALTLRGWSFHVGYYNGREVARQLRRAHVANIQERLADAGAIALGMLLPILAVASMAGPLPGLPWLVVVVIGALLGVRFGNTVRTPVIAVLIAAMLLTLAVALVP
ncbi:MAG: PTS system mannose/fructose/sorbose family transporter subunit IID [Longimicrobiales bacterium]